MVSTTRSRFSAAKVTVKSAFGLRAGVRCGGRPYDCAALTLLAGGSRVASQRAKVRGKSLAIVSGFYLAASSWQQQII
jgi:hypothetical protein